MPILDFDAETIGIHDLFSSTLPCILVDRDGLIRKASPAANDLCSSPLNRSLEEAFAISMGSLAEHLASQGLRVLVGKCTDVNQRTSHVIAQAAEWPSATLIMLTDLSSSRHAEERRFDVTPYPVLRLSVDGLILFANRAAEQKLGANLLNRSLPDFFPEVARAELTRSLATNPRDSQEFDLPAPDSVKIAGEAKEVRLYLMPDLGPANYLIGRVGVISWDPYESFRDRINQAVNRAGGWVDAFREMLDVLREAVPHDRAFFGVLGEEGTRFRITLVHPSPDPPWPRRWINVPPQRLERLSKGPYVERDWAEVMKKIPELALDPTVSRNLKDGILTTLMLPIGRQGQPDGVLTLASRNQGAFGGQALPMLSSLRIESHVATLLRMAEHEDVAAVRKIGDDIVKASSVAGAFDLLLKGLVEHFQWDHAAIFFADRVGKRTLIARQYPHLNEVGMLDELAVSPGYTQPLDPDLPRESGMLGAAFFADGPKVVVDTEALDADGNPPLNYRTPDGAKPRRSAMTLPIKSNGDIRWLLDIESLTTHAFGIQDSQVVAKIVADLEQKVALLNERVLSVALLDIIEQGSVISSRDGHILRANRRAKDLLRLDLAGDNWGRIADHGADLSSQAILASRDIIERQPIRIRGLEGGVGNAVLASRRALDEDTGDSVWLLTDLRVDEWQHDSRFIESTIREVARQVRGPLQLAASFVKRIADGSATRDLAPRAVAELGKADLTYEKIAESFEARKAPLRGRRPLLLDAIVADVLEHLPRSDGCRIHSTMPRTSLRVAGDGGRMKFALRLIIIFFLTLIKDPPAHENKIYLQLLRRRAKAVIGLSLDSTSKSGARLVKLAAESGVPLETASVIIAAHGGQIVGAGLDSGYPCLEVRLPLSEADHAA